jgi:hypothetical protein
MSIENLPTGHEIIKALREGKARDFTAMDWHAWAGASEGSVILDCFPGFEVVVGAENMAIDASDEEGNCYMLTRSGWQTA